MTVFCIDGRESAIWWMRYRDQSADSDGLNQRGASNWEDANKKLRERLNARDQNVLEVIRKGEQLFVPRNGRGGFFLQNYSQNRHSAKQRHIKPIRAALKHLNRFVRICCWATLRADEIDLYLRSRLQQRVRCETLNGLRRTRPD